MAEQHELWTTVLNVIEGEIRTHVERDGGRIRLHSIEGDEVFVELSGHCSSCSASDITLKAGVERILRKRVPQIRRASIWPTNRV